MIADKHTDNGVYGAYAYFGYGNSLTVEGALTENGMMERINLSQMQSSVCYVKEISY